MGNQFIMPGQIVTGEDALLNSGDLIKELGKKALIITDSMMVKLGNCSKLENLLSKNDIPYVVYEGINNEPTEEMVLEGLSLYQNENCDFLISLGGGSPIDAMKAIGALATNGGRTSYYMGKEITKKTPPTIAIPTTAGTGSEATQFTIITDTQKDIKMLLKGSVLMPNLAIIDPQFTVTVPDFITSATGLDALTHAIEAYTSKKAQSLSDTFAISAIKRIFKYLLIAYKDGKNLEAREEMSIAALEAGIAFNNASVTIIHGLSRPIGALFHVPHGLSNAILLEEGFKFALDGAYDRFATLGREIGVATKEDSDKIASEKFLDAVIKLVQDLEIPNLEKQGIDKSHFLSQVDKMAEDAMASGSPSNTIKEVNAQNLKDIYKKLWA